MIAKKENKKIKDYFENIIYIIYIMFDLCKYRNVFGEPGKGAHKYRLMNIAIIDVAFTIIVAYIFSWFTSWNFWITLLAAFILGIFFHRLFCVRTTIDKLLFS